MGWSDPQKNRKIKVVRMNFPRSDNDRMLRGIIFKLPIRPQLRYKAKSFLIKNILFFRVFPIIPTGPYRAL